MTIRENKEYIFCGEIIAKHHDMSAEFEQVIKKVFISDGMMVHEPEDIEIKEIASSERNPRYRVLFRTYNECNTTKEQTIYVIERTIMGCHQDIIGMGPGSNITRLG